jgi:hypothetical protein
VTMGALAEPFGTHATTFGARKDSFNFGHETLWRAMRLRLVV